MEIGYFIVNIVLCTFEKSSRAKTKIIDTTQTVLSMICLVGRSRKRVESEFNETPGSDITNNFVKSALASAYVSIL